MTFRRACFVLIAVPLAAFSIRGQEVINFSFEEFATGATPAFVSKAGPFSPPIVIDSSTAPFIQPLEGQKYLRGGGSISIQSPNGQPISSYSLLLYLPDPGLHVSFGIGGQSLPVSFNIWQTFEGTFATPQTDLKISAFVQIGETFGTSYYIDDIHFITVPEPADWTLFGLGAIAIVLLDRSRRRPNLPV